MEATMTLKLVVLSIALLAMTAPDVLAAPKQSSTGVACNSTGTARKDGKDQNGNKVNCEWDTCTYCGTTSGVIDCRIQLTEYSNPRDCKPAAIKPRGQSIINSHIFGVFDGFDSNPTRNHPNIDAGAAPKTKGRN
jgi:hypothetical protein